jgi:hypothetical protein
MFDLAIRTTRLHRLLKGVRKPWAHYLERRDLDRFSALAQRLFEQLARDSQIDFSGAPRIAHAIKTRSDVAVLLVAAPSGEVSRVLKLPLSPGAEQSIAAHRQVLIALHQAPGLEHFRELIPRPLGWGEFEGQAY